MSKESKTEVRDEKDSTVSIPEPIDTYPETFIYPSGHEKEGQEYTVLVKVYEPEVNPTEGLNPAM